MASPELIPCGTTSEPSVPQDDAPIPDSHVSNMSQLETVWRNHPAHKDDRFWGSSFYRKPALHSDRLILALTVCSCLLALQQYRTSPSKASSINRVSCIVSLVIGVGQQLLLVWSPKAYWQCRGLFVVWFRLQRVIIVAMSLNAGMQLWTGCESNNITSRRAQSIIAIMVDTCRLVIVGSGSASACMHSCAQLLPFKHSVLLQSAHLVISWVFIAKPLAHALDKHATSQVGARHLCGLLSRIAEFTAAAPITKPETTAQCPAACGVHAMFYLVTTIQLFVGFLLPAFVAYHIEQRLKLSFTHCLQPGFAGMAPPSVIRYRSELSVENGRDESNNSSPQRREQMGSTRLSQRQLRHIPAQPPFTLRELAHLVAAVLVLALMACRYAWDFLPEILVLSRLFATSM